MNNAQLSSDLDTDGRKQKDTLTYSLLVTIHSVGTTRNKIHCCVLIGSIIVGFSTTDLRSQMLESLEAFLQGAAPLPLLHKYY